MSGCFGCHFYRTHLCSTSRRAPQTPVSGSVAVQLYDLVTDPTDVHLRHLAFLMLQRLAAQPPTLYRPRAAPTEEEAAGAAAEEPSESIGGRSMLQVRFFNSRREEVHIPFSKILGLKSRILVII